jgi:hypothetical protein
MKSLFAVLVIAAALFVGACNTNSGASGAPTVKPITSPLTTSPETSPMTSPEASPSA